MNLIFKSIHIENFMSISDADVDLSNGGYTLVSGVNNCQSDGACSNGSGKSSIWEAISWCLTGSTIRGSKNVVNINSEGGSLVELKLVVDKDEYVIKRTKEHSKLKTNLFVVVNGEDKSGKGIRDTEKILQNLLPDITPSLIGSVVILGQGLPQRFTNNTPSGRKEVLEKLSKSDFMIEDLKQRVFDRKSELQKKLREVEDALCSLESQRSTYENNSRMSQSKLESLESVDDLKHEIETLENDIEQIEDLIRDKQSFIKAKESEVQSLREQYALIDVDKQAELKSCEEMLESSLKELEVKFEPEIQRILEEKASLNAEMTSLRSRISEIDSIQDVCPTCHRKLDGVVKPDTSEYVRKLDETKLIFKKAEDALSDVQSEYGEKKKLVKSHRDESKQSVLDKYDDKLREIADAGRAGNAEVTTCRGEIDVMSSRIAEMTKHIAQLRSKVAEHDATVKSCEENIKYCSDKVVEIVDKIKYNTIDRDITREHIEVVNKFNTYVTRDFRGHLLKNVIAYIDLKAKEYATEIFENSNISFELNGNSIDILYSNKDYENLSGGEKQKVDLIVQFAIRDMLCKFLNFGSNILVVDEIFDNLDSVGCKRVLNMISTKLCDISSIYIVTHHVSDLDIPYDSEIVVTKSESGVSTINVV